MCYNSRSPRDKEITFRYTLRTSLQYTSYIPSTWYYNRDDSSESVLTAIATPRPVPIYNRAKGSAFIYI